MIKTIALRLLLMAVLLAPLSAKAQSSRIYFTGYLGLNTFNDLDYSNSTAGTSGSLQVDNTLSFGGALGFRLNKATRVEAELGYGTADMDSLTIAGTNRGVGGDIRATTFMMNGYYDLATDWPVQPFVGLGLGVGLFDSNITTPVGFSSSTSGNDWGLLYQIGGGLKYRVNDTLAFTGGYRYLDSINDLSLGNADIDYSTHEFRLGLEYDLPVAWDMPN